ncbi:MAG: helicase-related protein, partial [Bowdeniella nasicola]|nr:helicase-related protein [Bowdeniella nasicola]
ADIVVGTHALFSDDVTFADLALAVVDEQHRFGVEQRDELRHTATGATHMLHMTATPIPRTIALTVFGDLDTSVLQQLPHGRAGVHTYRVREDNPTWMERMYARLGEEIANGGRVFVVCARIDPTEAAGDDTRQLHTVAEMVDHLHAQPPLADATIGMLHGRMKPEEKDRVMADFIAGSTQILVSTTVIEVGVDVPSATAMVIWDADRFGLAQLHQLRGRIGRGVHPGICFVIDPGSTTGGIAVKRLETFTSTTDGFALAEADVELRREGDVLGAQQSGFRSGLRVLSALRDGDIIASARRAAGEIVTKDPTLASYPALAAAVQTLSDAGDYLERT